MNKKTTTASVTLGASGYEAPKAEVMDVHSEGIICSSPEGDNEIWGWDEDLWS